MGGSFFRRIGGFTRVSFSFFFFFRGFSPPVQWWACVLGCGVFVCGCGVHGQYGR